MTTNEIEQRINAAIQTVGLNRIRPHEWGVVWRKNGWEYESEGSEASCCPLGAILVSENPTWSEELAAHSAITRLLDAGPEWVDAFAYAFDGKRRLDSHPNDAYQLGAKFRNELVAVEP